jgi:alkylhydroperoxidase/carboxymuconolactone decarboxylase family protein YurZ
MSILTKKHQKLYESFYESTHNNDYLDTKTEILVGLSAALAMNCSPCTSYYLKVAKKENISKGEIKEVLAKVMAVAAGQKRLQLQEVIEENKIDIELYK